MGIFKENYTLLMERFPQLALEMPAVEELLKEPEPLFPIGLDKVDLLYFKGLGMGEGYESAKKWLHADPVRKLVFLEDDLEAVCRFLYAGLAHSVLRDPQVVIEQSFDLGRLAERFPAANLEVSGLPSKGCFGKLKEELLWKTAYAHAIQIDRFHGYQPFYNFVRNVRRLSESFYANGLKGRFKGTAAIVCGAGPSLTKAFGILSKMENKALLIAGGSTLAALSAQHISPHFGMAVDPNPEEFCRLKNSFCFEIPFLYSTRVFPSVFNTVNGPFGYMRAGVGGVPEIWMEEELGFNEKLIGSELSSDAISVTSMCLAWAEYLGCNPILLSGVDLAYTDNRRYAPGVCSEREKVEEGTGAAHQIIRKIGRDGKPVDTAIRWLMEAAALSDFAKNHPDTQFINTTEGGIGFEAIPYMPLEDAVAPFENSLEPLRIKVHQAIGSSPMPVQTREVIQNRMEELSESLNEVIYLLEILAEIKPGSAALAEVELPEQIAYNCLFYDALKILDKGREESIDKWKRFLDLAKQYRSVFSMQ